MDLAHFVLTEIRQKKDAQDWESIWCLAARLYDMKDVHFVEEEETEYKISISRGILGSAVHHLLIGLLAGGLQVDL